MTCGLTAVGYCAFVLGSSWIFEEYESLKFDREAAQGKTKPAAREAPPTGSVLGKIVISRLGLSAVVVEGSDDKNLRRATGHIPGTALPGEAGNVAIAGHRDSFFRPLKNIHADDQVELVTLRGKERYRVVSTEIVGPADIGVLRPTKEDTLTLVTCYPFYYVGSAPKRFIVKARKIALPTSS